MPPDPSTRTANMPSCDPATRASRTPAGTSASSARRASREREASPRSAPAPRVCGSTQNAASASAGQIAGSCTDRPLSTRRPRTGAKSHVSDADARTDARNERAVATFAVSRDAGASHTSTRSGSPTALARMSVATTAEIALQPVRTAIPRAAISSRRSATDRAYATLSERSTTSARRSSATSSSAAERPWNGPTVSRSTSFGCTRARSASGSSTSAAPWETGTAAMPSARRSRTAWLPKKPRPPSTSTRLRRASGRKRRATARVARRGPPSAAWPRCRYRRRPRPRGRSRGPRPPTTIARASAAGRASAR